VTADLARLGGVVGALGLSVLLVAPRRTWRLGGLAGWVLGCALLAYSLAPAGHHRAYAAAAVFGAVVSVLLAWLFLRAPWTLAVAVLACAPARIPVSVGSTHANLLLPLYVVVSGAALALAVELAAPGWVAHIRAGRIFEPRGRHTGEPLLDPTPPEREAPALGPFAWPAAVLAGWSGIALLWSPARTIAHHTLYHSLSSGAIYLLFYLLPLGLIAVCLARVRWSIGWVKLLYVQLAAMGVVFALIGLYQYATRTVYWNPKVKVDNAYAPVGWFYRVNSVFYDPSIYGRFLVIAILASVVLVLFARGWVAWAAAGAATLTLVGLIPSFSQSSYFSLAVGVAAALVVLWRRRALIPLLVTAAVLAAVTFGMPQLRHRVLGKANLSHATGTRSELVSNGAGVFAHHPLTGVGTGGFIAGYAREAHKVGRASHDAPITVAAETGIVGLAALAWLLVVVFTVPYRGNRGETALDRARLAFGLALLAIVVHSLFYNALIEDPLLWGLVALSAVALRERPA
jgi:O-antigen ligase